MDAQTVRAAYLAMHVITWFVIIPFCLAALVTGLVQSLGTTWGLFRHYWVATKLLLTVLATIILLVHTQPINQVAAMAANATLSSSDVRQLRLQLVGDAAAALFVLLMTTALSIYKPWGLTPSVVAARGIVRGNGARHWLARGDTPDGVNAQHRRGGRVHISSEFVSYPAFSTVSQKVRSCALKDIMNSNAPLASLIVVSLESNHVSLAPGTGLLAPSTTRPTTRNVWGCGVGAGAEADASTVRPGQAQTVRRRLEVRAMVKVSRLLKDYADSGALNERLAVWGFVDPVTFLRCLLNPSPQKAAAGSLKYDTHLDFFRNWFASVSPRRRDSSKRFNLTLEDLVAIHELARGAISRPPRSDLTAAAQRPINRSRHGSE
jgi:hypothetical protein